MKAWKLEQGVDWVQNLERWRFLSGETPDGDALVNYLSESSLVEFASKTRAGMPGGTCRWGRCRVDCTRVVEVGWFLAGVLEGLDRCHIVQCP